MFIDKKKLKQWQSELAEEKTIAWLKTFIIIWAIVVIFLALLIDNPWILAAILIYEVT